MSKADKMFASLNYELTVYDGNYAVQDLEKIAFVYKKKLKREFNKTIGIVIFENKDFEISCDVNGRSEPITKRELEAINKKLEELGL